MCASQVIRTVLRTVRIGAVTNLASATRSIWSYVVGLRASWRWGRVLRLERHERKREALRVARGGLDMLRRPGVHRERSAEGCAMISLTMAVERLARALDEPGASAIDVRDSVSVLRDLAPRGDSAIASLPSKWLPYLEERLESLDENETIH